MPPDPELPAPRALEFLAEDATSGPPLRRSHGGPWKVLVVDDEAEVHKVTEFALGSLLVDDRGMQFLRAYSAREARALLEADDDIAVILLDVVMESPDAGLQLVRWIREDLLRHAVRIILYTGQPGYAPQMEVIQDYDIDGYKVKSELNGSQLAVALITAIRSFKLLRTLDAGRRGLEQIVADAAELFGRRNLQDFYQTVLRQCCRLIGPAATGLACTGGHADFSGDTDSALRVVAATGSFAGLAGRLLDDGAPPGVVAAVEQARTEQAICFDPDSIVYYLRDSSNADLIVYVDTADATVLPDGRLLDVFCANLSVAFENVRLLNRLHVHAYTDQLTGLPNRTRFVLAIDEGIAPSRESLTVAIIDIDDFSEINDALGHDTGDLLLKAVARRLTASVGEHLYVARIAADSFGVLGPHPDIDPEQLLRMLGEPYQVGPHLLQVSFSIGLVRLSETRSAGLDAIKDASIGLERAKSRRQTGYCYFTQDMETATKERVKLALGLRRGIRSQQLLLHYQPQVELASGRVVGAEALLRWRNPDGSFIPPQKFIPVAESSGLIRPIGDWTLRTAARQLRTWRDRFGADFRVAVNVSIIQFQAPGFVTTVAEVLDEFGVAPGNFELEITESLVSEEMEILADSLQRIRDLGVSIAIDDFGTGYSSLAYLHRLNVNRLKIDRVFINGLDGTAGVPVDRSGFTFASMPEMIIRLAHGLNLQVVAEGVETAGQASILRELGCEEAQGYHYCRPLPADAFEKWLEARKYPSPAGA